MDEASTTYIATVSSIKNHLFTHSNTNHCKQLCVKDLVHIL